MSEWKGLHHLISMQPDRGLESDSDNGDLDSIDFEAVRKDMGQLAPKPGKIHISIKK